MFATHAAIALENGKLVERLETSIRSRHIIGVAQGILMQQHSISEAGAFSLLRRYATAQQLTIGAVARLLVDEMNTQTSAP